jgi:hypothetical protein
MSDVRGYGGWCKGAEVHTTMATLAGTVPTSTEVMSTAE